MAANFGPYVIFAAFMNLVVTVIIQDTFMRCYNNQHANNQLHYRETRTSTRVGCALVCLPEETCTGFDVCPLEDKDRNHDEQICKIKNSTQMESCEAHNQNGISPPCESYRRVSKRSVYHFISLRILPPGKEYIIMEFHFFVRWNIFSLRVLPLDKINNQFGI
jgi:hypothetical protein